MFDLLPFLFYVAGLITGYSLFFREDREEEIWDKRRRLGYHLNNYHGD